MNIISTDSLYGVWWVFFPAAVSDSEPIQAVRGVKVGDIGVNFFTLSWNKAPRASGYKISWIPFLGKRPHTVICLTMCAYSLGVTYSTCMYTCWRMHLLKPSADAELKLQKDQGWLFSLFNINWHYNTLTHVGLRYIYLYCIVPPWIFA